MTPAASSWTLGLSGASPLCMWVRRVCMSCSLTPEKRYIGDHIGDYYQGY